MPQTNSLNSIMLYCIFTLSNPLVSNKRSTRLQEIINVNRIVHILNKSKNNNTRGFELSIKGYKLIFSLQIEEFVLEWRTKALQRLIFMIDWEFLRTLPSKISKKASSKFGYLDLIVVRRWINIGKRKAIRRSLRPQEFPYPDTLDYYAVQDRIVILYI